ncbi:uncharacterized protein PG986_003654 [Apiospora aurea]|uniref:F-box domain-containing protein n=1 Tax=Apiospora aurea TaxID=335848 RepID=A0ABR1QS93_9PEZI
MKVASMAHIPWPRLVKCHRETVPPYNWQEHIDYGPYREKWELEGLWTLARLCRTSSRLRVLAERALYSNLDLSDSRIRARAFSAVRNSPRLAQHVQSLELGEAYMTRGEFVVLTPPPGTTTNTTHETQRQGSIPAFQQWFVDLLGAMHESPDFAEEFADAWPAYAITVMPSLKYLDITMPNDTVMLPSVFRGATKCDGKTREPQSHHSSQGAAGKPSSPPVATGPPQPLSQLEEIIIRRVSEVKGALQMKSFEDLLLLPRLRKIYGFHVDLNTSVSIRTSRTSNSLVHVDLRDSLADAVHIMDLLRTCPLLRTLRVQWGDSMVGDSELEWHEVGRALTEYGSNLEVLDLDCRCCLNYEMGEWSGSLCSLKSLWHLKHLSLPLDILKGSEDELRELEVLTESDEEEDGDGDCVGSKADPTGCLEELLPKPLESLNLYSGYEEVDWLRKCVQGVLSSRRLSSLSHVQLDGAEWLGLAVDETGWERKNTDMQLRFYRTKPTL